MGLTVRSNLIVVRVGYRINFRIYTYYVGLISQKTVIFHLNCQSERKELDCLLWKVLLIVLMKYYIDRLTFQIVEMVTLLSLL